MPFFKKNPGSLCIGSIPIVTPTVQRSKSLDDDKLISVSEAVVNLDTNDPSNFPTFPDVDEFNNLELQLASGVIPQPVSTVQIVSDNVAGEQAFNEIIENVSFETESTPTND